MISQNIFVTIFFEKKSFLTKSTKDESHRSKHYDGNMGNSINDGRNYTALFILLGKINTMLIVGTQDSQVKNNAGRPLGTVSLK